MKIELTQVAIGELVEGYADNSSTEEGIVGYGGRTVADNCQMSMGF